MVLLSSKIDPPDHPVAFKMVLRALNDTYASVTLSRLRDPTQYRYDFQMADLPNLIHSIHTDPSFFLYAIEPQKHEVALALGKWVV